MGERRIFSKEFKEQAAELALRGDRRPGELAAELGITGNMLSRRRREAMRAKASAVKAFPGQGIPRDEELVRLRKENKDLREANETLKKATAFFAAPNPR